MLFIFLHKPVSVIAKYYLLTVYQFVILLEVSTVYAIYSIFIYCILNVNESPIV